ncbi:hypothetical protein Aduo_019215 [Ancylostoma duodenale]
MVRTRQSQLSQVPSNQSVPPSINFSNDSLDDECFSLLGKINEILAKKAPECIPLLNDLISKVPLVSSEAEDKRKRSIVIYGVKEADKTLPAVERQKHTEEQIEGILNPLDVETRPVEIFRMGKPLEGRPGLVKVVFSSRHFYFDALRKAYKLRHIPTYSGVYLRRSMTAEERNKDRALRAQARELNAKEGDGRKICRL